jgi:secreted trypsin-like serine protease
MQVALVHGGVNKCGDANFPGIYTRLEDSEVLDFIHQIVFGKRPGGGCNLRTL